MNLRVLLCVSVVLPASACGDNGGGTDSATTTSTTTSTTLPTGTDGSSGGSSGSSSGTPTGSGGQTESGTMSASDGSSSTSGSSSGTDGTTSPVSASSTGSTGDSTSTTGSTSGSSTTGMGPCMPGDTQGMGDVEKSYLWVANSDQGTVSKVDTLTLTEVARYATGPGGGNYTENPSRTAVSLDGRFVVVNGRQSARATVIAANVEDCTDNNGNGMIDTSQNKNDVRPFGQDECMKWSIVLPSAQGNIGAGPRGVTWTPGTWDMDACAFKDPKIWVGYLPPQPNVAHMVRLNGMTGMIEETVVIGNWTQGWNDYGPYGAALDKNLNVWFTGLRGELFRINTANNPATFDRWTPPGGTESYGMTVDPDGDPWMAGCFGPVTTFEPKLNKFTAVEGQQECYRGIAADKDGSVWVASNGTCGVAQIDHKTNTWIQFHNLAPCNTPVGVSTDLEGFVWVVDEYFGAWKIDPMNPGAKMSVMIANDHYTYSDMTGGQLKSVVLPQ